MAESDGIEPPTYGLTTRCSTPELTIHLVKGVGFEPTTTRFQSEDSGQTELTPVNFTVCVSALAAFWRRLYLQNYVAQCPLTYSGN